MVRDAQRALPHVLPRPQPAVQVHLLRALGGLPEFPGGEKKRYPYLFFESNFDIPWRRYIDAFAYVIPKDISVIWGRGFAFPGPPPAEPLKRWIAMNSLEGGHYYMAYPEASVKMTMASLEAGTAAKNSPSARAA